MANNESPPVLHAEGVTKRYGRRTALDDVHLSIPQGRVIGLVGPNGAGKSTLLKMACGLILPTSGTLTVLGSRPSADAAHLARVGFVAQDTPVYASFSIADHLRMGAHLNPGWDQVLADRRIAQIGLNPSQKAGGLSGGQRAQLALTLAVAKRPDLLIFDEPAAALDPLARNMFLSSLMKFVTELGASAVLSSHLLSDVERVCDYLIVLCESKVQVAGDVRELLDTHHRITGPRGSLDQLPAGVEVIQAENTAFTNSFVVHACGPLPSLFGSIESIELEELVLSYMTRAQGRHSVPLGPSVRGALR